MNRTHLVSRRRHAVTIAARSFAPSRGLGRRDLVETLETRRLLVAIAPGQTLTGGIGAAGQTTSYTFTVAAGDTFRLSVGDVSAASSTAKYRPSLQVLNASGVAVINADANGFSGTAVYGQYTVPATSVGTYTAVVKDYTTTNTGGVYAIELEKSPATPVADSDGDSGALTSGQTRAGTINRFGDLDAYTISAAAGDTFRISLGDTTPASSTSNFEPELNVIGPTGLQAIYTDANGFHDTAVYGQFTVPATATGTYTVLVQDYYGNSSGGTYAVEMIKIPAVVTADTNGDGGVIASGQTKTGTVNRFGDMDAFTFNATAGDTFTLGLGDTTPDTSTSDYHPTLIVYGPAGNQIIYSDTNGFHNTAAYGQFTVPATAPGTYTVVVEDYYGNQSNGTYALEMIKVPGTLAGDSDGNGGAIVNGQTVNGTIHRYGDLDAYTFSVAAGETFRLSVGDISPDSSVDQYHPSFQVFNSKGASVLDIDTNGFTDTAALGQYTVPATAVGTYTLVVRDYYGNQTNGNYAVEYVKSPGTLVGDSNAQGGAIASGQTKNGTINRFGDLDAYTFTPAAGNTFNVTLTDTSPTSSADKYHPTFRVVGPDGVQRLIRDANGNAGTSVTGAYTVPATAVGQYVIVVEDYYGNAMNGTYALQLSGATTPVAPAKIFSVAVDDGTTQRSVVRSLTVTFDRVIPAANFAPGAFAVTQTTGTPATYATTVASVTASGGRTAVRLTFSGNAVVAGSLGDGQFVLSVDGNKITDTAGVKVDALGNGTPGSIYTYSFHRLFGDADGDRGVSINDFNAFSSAFGKTSTMVGFVAAFDYDNDGGISINDFNELSTRFGRVV